MNWLYFFLAIIIIIFILLIFSVVYSDGDRYLSIVNTSDLTYRLKELDNRYGKKVKIKNCIITLTSTPDRLFNVRPTLISLLDQSVAVEEIRLNIPYYSCKGDKYKIPKWLKNLKHVKIHRTRKDWGPATKLIPTLLDFEQFKNKKIIVVDDDVIYGYYTVDLLNEYFDKYDRENRKTAITIYGDVIGKNYDTDNGLYTRISNYVLGENFVDLLRGHAAYLVTPEMFTQELYNYDKIPRECFFVDDNYFSAHLRNNNVKILQVGMSFKAVPLPEMETCQISPLHQGQNHDGRNERVVNRFFR